MRPASSLSMFGLASLVRSGLATLVLIFSSTVFAGPVEDLLALPERPTVKQIKDAFGGRLPEQNPFGTPDRELQKIVLKKAPSVVAKFEKTFPGATFAALGRDAVFLGDILDGFFQSLGQFDRVVRVSASGASLTKDADIVGYLKGLGVDLATMEKRPAFVIFDQTRFHSDSQSTTYLRAMFQACRKTPGCDPQRLVEKFNFINTGAARNMYGVNLVDESTDVREFLGRQASDLAAHSSGGIPSSILSVWVPEPLVYTTEYHDTFGKFTRTADGRVVTSPGPMSSDQTRRQILADVFETIKTVADPLFLEAIDRQARTMGFAYPKERVKSQREIERIQGLDHLIQPMLDSILRSPTAKRDQAFDEAIKFFYRISRNAPSTFKRLETALLAEPVLKELAIARIRSSLLTPLSTPASHEKHDKFYTAAHLLNLSEPLTERIVVDLLVENPELMKMWSYLYTSLRRLNNPRIDQYIEVLIRARMKVTNVRPIDAEAIQIFFDTVRNYPLEFRAYALSIFWRRSFHESEGTVRPQVLVRYLEAATSGLKSRHIDQSQFAQALAEIARLGATLEDSDSLRSGVRELLKTDEFLRREWKMAESIVHQYGWAEELRALKKPPRNRCVKAIQNLFSSRRGNGPYTPL